MSQAAARFLSADFAILPPRTSWRSCLSSVRSATRPLRRRFLSSISFTFLSCEASRPPYFERQGWAWRCSPVLGNDVTAPLPGLHVLQYRDDLRLCIPALSHRVDPQRPNPRVLNGPVPQWQVTRTRDTIPHTRVPSDPCCSPWGANAQHQRRSRREIVNSEKPVSRHQLMQCLVMRLREIAVIRTAVNRTLPYIVSRRPCRSTRCGKRGAHATLQTRHVRGPRHPEWSYAEPPARLTR